MLWVKMRLVRCVMPLEVAFRIEWLAQVAFGAFGFVALHGLFLRVDLEVRDTLC